MSVSAEAQREPTDRSVWLALALLLLVTLAIYARSAAHPFVAFDDPVYVSENPLVERGLTLEGLRWAFGAHAGNWHPLTWLSHMLDCELFGRDAGKHHLVSAALHALNTLLLFVALRRLTHRPWPALLCAALFALHPLRVESVAWISERKDVLAGTFWMLALIAYEGWARRGGAGRYLVLVLCLALGLMAKSMLVTLPCVLLLLDRWPLRRLGNPAQPSETPTPRGDLGDLSGKTPAARRGFTVWLEKLPLFALVLAVGGATFAIQRAEGAVGTLQSLSLSERLANAVLSWGVYLAQTFWPARLACSVPHPAAVAKQAELARELYRPALFVLLGLVAITVLVLVQRRRRPYLFTGWFWYLGTLVPVIGIVQVGVQAHADRYTYLPGIGIALALAFWVAELGQRSRRARRLLVPLSATSLLVLAGLAARQVGFWRDSRTLFEHALAVSERNYVALTYLGRVERRAGNNAAARDHLQQALEFQPRNVEAMLELALAHRALGELVEARRIYKRVLRNEPTNAPALQGLHELGE